MLVVVGVCVENTAALLAPDYAILDSRLLLPVAEGAEHNLIFHVYRFPKGF